MLARRDDMVVKPPMSTREVEFGTWVDAAGNEWRMVCMHSGRQARGCGTSTRTQAEASAQPAAAHRARFLVSVHADEFGLDVVADGPGSMVLTRAASWPLRAPCCASSTSPTPRRAARCSAARGCLRDRMRYDARTAPASDPQPRDVCHARPESALEQMMRDGTRAMQCVTTGVMIPLNQLLFGAGAQGATDQRVSEVITKNLLVTACMRTDSGLWLRGARAQDLWAGRHWTEFFVRNVDLFPRCVQWMRECRERSLSPQDAMELGAIEILRARTWAPKRLTASSVGWKTRRPRWSAARRLWHGASP
jgi:hypothetical protein